MKYAYRRLPSVQALMAAFRIDAREAHTIRHTIRSKGLAGLTWGGFFGVESVRRADGSVAFYYANSGDTYSPTIVRRAGSDAYRISTMGDEVEALERRGVKLP